MEIQRAQPKERFLPSPPLYPLTYARREKTDKIKGNEECGKNLKALKDKWVPQSRMFGLLYFKDSKLAAHAAIAYSISSG